MAQQTINVGTVANDNTGDPIRDAFVKVQANFDEAYATGIIDGTLVITGNDLTTSVANANITITANGTGIISLITDTVNITTPRTPSFPIGVSGDLTGDIAWDVNYIYVCTADWDGGTSVWKRSALT